MWWVATGSWPTAIRHRHHVSRTNRTLLDVSCVALLQIDEIAIFILRTIIQIMKRSTLMGCCKHCKRWACTFNFTSTVHRLLRQPYHHRGKSLIAAHSKTLYISKVSCVCLRWSKVCPSCVSQFSFSLSIYPFEVLDRCCVWRLATLRSMMPS